MIQCWRSAWGYDFPFYFAQIAPFRDYVRGRLNGTLLRESQLKVAQSVPFTGMAVLLDIGERTNIHPLRKKQVGERLAYWALAKTYGLGSVEYTALIYKSMQVKGASAVLSFTHTGQGLHVPSGVLNGFEIAGADRIFYPAKARIISRRKQIQVSSDKVKHPVAVRYCFHDWCVGTLFGINGLPVSSFRTDNWK